jgi:hypothetical protein
MHRCYRPRQGRQMTLTDGEDRALFKALDRAAPPDNSRVRASPDEVAKALTFCPGRVSFGRGFVGGGQNRRSP